MFPRMEIMVIGRKISKNNENCSSVAIERRRKECMNIK